MSSFASILIPLRRPLAAPLSRLRQTLDSLGKEMRVALARAVSQAVADAVREAVSAVLEESSPHPDSAAWSAQVPVHPPPSWEDPDAAYWPNDGYGLEELEELLYPDAAGERPSFREGRESPRSRPPGGPPRPQQNRWGGALKAGFLAGAWWLRRPPGRFPLLGALGVSLLAGLAALACGPLAAAVAGAAGSGLLLLGLADAVRYGCPLETNSRSH